MCDTRLSHFSAAGYVVSSLPSMLDDATLYLDPVELVVIVPRVGLVEVGIPYETVFVDPDTIVRKRTDLVDGNGQLRGCC